MPSPELPTYKIKTYKAESLVEHFSYMLIRPPRFLYNEGILLPNHKYEREFEIETYKIPFKLTVYKPPNPLYIILYLHGNSSSRLEGFLHLRELPQGVGLACFDFGGCGGRFEHDYVTLGKRESEEVDIAAKFLKEQGHKVVGWGRSMGSVSLLLSKECEIIVADSPFSSLSDLCKESSKKFLPSFCCCLVECLYPCLFSFVRKDVKKKSGLDVNEMEIYKIVQNESNKNRKLFIMAGKDDGMIDCQHSKRIYDAFPGKKEMSIFEGTHNSQRPSEVFDKAFEFIEKELGINRKRKVTKQINLKSVQKTFVHKTEEININIKQAKEKTETPLDNLEVGDQSTSDNLLLKIESKIKSDNDGDTAEITIQTNLLPNEKLENECKEIELQEISTMNNNRSNKTLENIEENQFVTERNEKSEHEETNKSMNF